MVPATRTCESSGELKGQKNEDGKIRRRKETERF